MAWRTRIQNLSKRGENELEKINMHRQKKYSLKKHPSLRLVKVDIDTAAFSFSGLMFWVKYFFTAWRAELLQMRRQDFYIQSIGGYSLPFGRWLLVKFGCLLRAPMDFKRFHRWLFGIRVTMARCIRSYYSAPSVPFQSNTVCVTCLYMLPLILFSSLINFSIVSFSYGKKFSRCSR